LNLLKKIAIKIIGLLIWTILKPVGIMRRLVKYLILIRMVLDQSRTKVKKKLDLNQNQKDPNFVIVVTTFELRLIDYALPLIKTIRNATPAKIICVINGNYRSNNDSQVKKKFFRELLEIEEVYPITHPKFLGMSASWNLGIKLGQSYNSLVFSDDIIVNNEKELVKEFKEMEEYFEENNFFIINESFAHFGITLECLSEIGWFDERFLGFGNEDGDFYFRYMQKYLKHPTKVHCSTLMHIDDQLKGEEYSEGNKHSRLNTVAVSLKYDFGKNKVNDLFGREVTKKSEEYQNYVSPLMQYETYDLLGISDMEFVENQLKKYF
jgi:hypothetical protein